MTRFERQQFFERIVALRDGYAVVAMEDRGIVLSVDAAIAYGEQLLEDPTLLALVVGDDTASATAQEGTSY